MNKYPSIKQAIIISAYILLLTLLIGVLLDLVSTYIYRLSGSFIEMITSTFALLIISIIYLRKRRAANQDHYLIRHDKVSLSLLLLLIPLSLLVFIILDPIDNLLPVPKWFNEIMMKVVTNDIYSFISVVIIAPVFEELISRGIILDGFLKTYEYKKAILYSSLVFGLMHLNPWQFVSAFSVGIYIGWIYYRTQSIIPCMIIHSLNNMIAFLLMVYFPNSSFITILGGSRLFYSLVILLSITVFITLIVFLNKKLRNTYSKGSIPNPIS